MKPLTAVQNIRFQLPVFGINRPCSCNNDQIKALLELFTVQPEDLSQATANSIAYDGFAYFFGYGKPYAVGSKPIFTAIDHHAGADSALSPGIYASEIAVEFDAGAGIQIKASHWTEKHQKGGLRRPVKHFQSAPFLLIVSDKTHFLRFFLLIFKFF